MTWFPSLHDVGVQHETGATRKIKCGGRKTNYRTISRSCPNEMVRREANLESIGHKAKNDTVLKKSLRMAENHLRREVAT